MVTPLTPAPAAPKGKPVASDQLIPELYGAMHTPAQTTPSSHSPASPATLLLQEEGESKANLFCIFPELRLWSSIPGSKRGMGQAQPPHQMPQKYPLLSGNPLDATLLQRTMPCPRSISPTADSHMPFGFSQVLEPHLCWHLCHCAEEGSAEVIPRGVGAGPAQIDVLPALSYSPPLPSPGLCFTLRDLDQLSWQNANATNDRTILKRALGRGAHTGISCCLPAPGGPLLSLSW